MLLPCNTTLPHAPRQRIFLDKYFPNIMHGYLNFHAGEPEEVVRAVRCCFNPLGPWAESLIYLLSGEREGEREDYSRARTGAESRDCCNTVHHAGQTLIKVGSLVPLMEGLKDQACKDQDLQKGEYIFITICSQKRNALW